MKNRFLIFTIIFSLLLCTCDMFISEQPWASGYFFEKPAGIEDFNYHYSEDGLSLILSWEPVADATSYSLSYSSGLFSNTVNLDRTVHEFTIPIVNILDPAMLLDSQLNYSITSINNIGSSEKVQSGVINSFGDGTENHPYRIIDRVTFWNIAPRSGNFILLKELNLGRIDLDQNFVLDGNFDGNGLFITYEMDTTLTSGGDLGLFESILASSSLVDLNVHGKFPSNPLTGANVGIIAGSNLGYINNCHAFAEIQFSGAMTSVGGVVGFNSAGAEVSDCASVGLIYANDSIGGIVGTNDGNVFSSVSLAHIQNNGSGANVGGIVGRHNNGLIENCGYQGNDTQTIVGLDYVGGIAGYSSGQIKSCMVIANIQSNNSAGGIVGIMDGPAGDIEMCSYSGRIDGSQILGGIVGELNSTSGNVFNCYFDGHIQGVLAVGGIIGRVNNTGTPQYVDEVYAQGSIDGGGTFGGLIGNASAGAQLTLINSVSSVEITATGNRIGGAVGLIGNTNILQNIISYGSVSGDFNIGGIAGDSAASIIDCQSYGDVTCFSNTAGGLIGITGASGTIDDSTSFGSVESPGDNVGGLIGVNNAPVNNCVSHSYINSTTAAAINIGGLVGQNFNTIDNSHAYGFVDSISTSFVGSLVGNNSGTVTVSCSSDPANCPSTNVEIGS